MLWHLETAFAAIGEEPTSPTLLPPSTSYLECHKDILRAKLTKAKCACRTLLGPLSERHSISPRDDSGHEMADEGIRCHVPPSSHLRGTHGEGLYLLLLAIGSSVESASCHGSLVELRKGAEPITAAALTPVTPTKKPRAFGL